MFTPMEQQQYLKLFGQYIKSIRLKNNLSVEEIANFCSITQQEVNQIENGEIDCQIVLVKNLADALGVDVHELFLFDMKLY